MTSNTPVDCLLEGADVDVTLLYVLPGSPAPIRRCRITT